MDVQFLTLFTGKKQVMLPTDQLVEVLSLEAPQITPIPDTPSHVMGVTNWRGEVLWVMDLASVLELDPLYKNPVNLRRFPVVIVVAHETTIGLAVVRVGQMMRCNPTEFRSESAETARFGHGVWVSLQGETYLTLSTEKLIQTPALEITR